MALGNEGAPVRECSALLQPGTVGLGMSDAPLEPDLTAPVLKEQNTVCSFADFNLTTSDLT